MDRLITISEAQARAALWVISNSNFVGRKYPDCQEFIKSVRAQDIDLKVATLKPTTTRE